MWMKGGPPPVLMFTLIMVSRNPHTHAGWSEGTPYKGRQGWGSDREGVCRGGADWECREGSCRPWGASHPQRHTELSPRDPAPSRSPLLVARCRPGSTWCAVRTLGDMEGADGSSKKHFGTQNTSRAPEAPAPNANPKMGPKKGASSER